MFRKILLPALAVLGVAFAIYTVKAGNKPVPASQPVAEPASSPFPTYVAGSGLIEAATENIAVGTHLPGVVTEVFVKVGDAVKAGAPLFKVDDRDAAADLAVREATLQSAKASLQKLQNQPRPEEIPVAEARLKETRATLENAKVELAKWQRVEDQRAVGPDELRQARLKVDIAEARVREAEADLKLLKAGAWGPDVEIARAQVVMAEAQVSVARTQLERLTVRSPVEGRVLQVSVRPGEFAQVGVLAQPLMLVGRTDVLHIRVDVDENEASRVRPGADAVAHVRGNSAIGTPLKFVRIDPYIVPKRSLTGDTTERVDTRVLQVLYAFEPKDLPVYVGQQMDVYINAPPIGGAAATSPVAAAK
ncbi:MAG TPA: HlyD family efflux transporter periplasmic adaptor subunit [Tepidisphaeraceae bacterium]|nr:HlyD family efflux transporter periplasmic adaptor subunit [Tepidisphaeraceae bacterium]